MRVALLLALVASAPAEACDPAAATDHPRIERAIDGHGVTISYRARLQVPLAAVDRMLSSPSSFPLWLPAVKEAWSTPEGFTAMYHLPWPLGRVREVMRVERHSDGDGVSHTWTRISGDFKRNEACWYLKKIGPSTTEVSYFAQLQLHRWVPLSMMRRAQKRALPRAAAALEAQAKLD
jgi:hypothetical protein